MEPIPPCWTICRRRSPRTKQQRCFKGHGFLHLAYARASDRRLVLGQEAVAGKASEIAESQLLLEWRKLAGAQVAIEAMACQAGVVDRHETVGGDQAGSRAAKTL